MKSGAQDAAQTGRKRYKRGSTVSTRRGVFYVGDGGWHPSSDAAAAYMYLENKLGSFLCVSPLKRNVSTPELRIAAFLPL